MATQEEINRLSLGVKKAAAEGKMDVAIQLGKKLREITGTGPATEPQPAEVPPAGPAPSPTVPIQEDGQTAARSVRHPTLPIAVQIPGNATPEQAQALLDAEAQRYQARVEGFPAQLEIQSRVERERGLQEQFPMLSPDQAAQFATDQDEAGFMSSVITGRGRKLPGVQELGADTVLGAFGKGSPIVSVGEMATIDPDALQNIWEGQLVDAGIEHEWRRDPSGEPILTYRDPETGEVLSGYINRPGMSPKDIPFLFGAIATGLGTRFGFNKVASAPLKGAVQGSRAIRYPVVGAGAGVGSLAMDQVADTAGGDIPAGEMALNASLATIFGGGIAAPVADVIQGGAKTVARRMTEIVKSSGEKKANEVRMLVQESTPEEVRKLFDDADADFWLRLSKEGEDAAMTPEQWREMAIYRAMEEEIPGFTPLRAFITGDPADFAQLDKAIRGGMYGPEVQNRLGRLQVQNREAIDQRARGMVRAPDEAGGIIREGLQGRAAEARASASELFETATSRPGSFAAPALDELPGRMENALIGANVKLAQTPLAPQFQTTAQVASLFEDLASRGDLDIQQFQQIRSYASNLANSAENAADRRAATTLLREFDTWADDVIERGLYSADPADVEILKQARSAWKQYLRTYSENPTRSKTGRSLGDQAGKVIADIIEQDLNPVAVVDNMINRTTIGAGKSSIAILDRLQKAVGRDSPEWSALQEAATYRVFYDPRGRLKPVDQIVKSWDSLKQGDARQWAGRLYGKDGFEEIDRFVSVLGRMQSKTNVYVPSGAPMERLERSLLGRLTTMAARTQNFVLGDVANQQMSRMSDRRIADAGRQAVEYVAPEPRIIPNVSLRSSLLAGERAAVTGRPDSDKR